VSVASEHILRAVGRRVQWMSGLLVPEAVVSYVTGFNERWNYEISEQYLADLMWVTPNGYATEFEIKVSRSDWLADKKKGKWGRLPNWLTRFVYVVPAELGVPDFVPPECGVWHYTASTYYHAEINVARAPKRIGTAKVPDKVRERWMRHLHCRFWYQRLYHKPIPEILPELDAA
jgi:hypothetical protein